MEFFDESDANDLEKMIKQEGIVSYDPTCVRKRSNWSKGANEYKFDTEHFKPEVLLKDIPDHSPKLDVLLKKIKQLDKQDQKKHGKLFKHFIFSDIKNGTYGAKLLASALIAHDMHLGYTAKARKGGKKKYETMGLLSDDELLKHKGDNFYLLSSVSVYDQNITTAMKKNILKKFNQRPENVYGDLARFIIMDSGFKEGIDLFDIKYVHIYEPSLVGADQKQVIGRGTRTCGQKGLEFHPQRGWPLHVFVYDLSIPEQLQSSFLGAKSAIDLYLKAKNIDVRLFHFAHDLEKTTIVGSVDYDLNKNIHSFSIPGDDAEEDLPEGAEFIYGGAAHDDPDFYDFSKTHKTIGGGPKLRIKNNKPAFILHSEQNAESQRMNHEELRKHIREHFSAFKWDDVKMENLCADKQKGGAGDVITLTPTQDFVQHYFTPENPVKGMLLYHSVGTGKTCSAIAAATQSFEKQNYTILWVTRTTLKNDIWKNMFEQVCNDNIRDRIKNSGLVIPDEQSKRMRLLSKSWRIRPMSYKQFSNLVSKQNAFYKALVKTNGAVDPLRKTLLIIDEAHKLYGGGDLSSIERPDMNALHQALMNSYQISGRDSVKLLLMTATPITEDPMELIKLINLCKPMGEQMPTAFDTFAQKYLNEEGQFSERGRGDYLDDIAGYVSYLNREKDARQFSQPQVQHINVPITKDMETIEAFDKKILKQTVSKENLELKAKIEENNQELKGELGDLDANKFNFLKEEICGDLEGKPLKACHKIVKSNIRQLVKEAKEEVKKIRAGIKEMRVLIKEKNEKQRDAAKNILKNIEENPEEYEQYKASMIYNLKNKCGIKIAGDKELKEYIKKHPHIEEYDQEIEMFNEKIKVLQNGLKLDVLDHKKRIEHLKKILKKDLSELERSVINLTIRDERKTFKQIMNMKKKASKKEEKGLKTSIKVVEKSRKKTYQGLKKTMKKIVKSNKKEQKVAEREAKKLRKTLRKQGEYKEEIKHELIAGLVDKYREKMSDNYEGYQAEVHEKDASKERMREEKAQAKQELKLEKERARQSKKDEKEKEKALKKAEKEREKEHARATKKLEKERAAALKKADKERQKEQLRKTKKNKP